MAFTALIIDDEPDIRELLEITLSRMDIDCTCVGDIASAKARLNDNAFDLCLTDMRLPDGDGINLVSYVQEKWPGMPVAVITAHGNMETAIQSLKAGAFDFLSKPIDLTLLRTLINSALKLSVTRAKSPQQDFVGESRAIQELRTKIGKLARNQAPVCIGGESGTGKELVARMIHEHGPRAEKPFIPVNCGAIPQDLMESEFFGHRKGSFTGATSDKDGFFQAADGGSIFLDEVADLPLHMQVKLLRAVQEKSVRPVGEQREIAVDVRILSATHKNLALLVKQNEFRQDLYYRINVIELNVPPLRERMEDIESLSRFILDRICQTNGMGQPRISNEAMDALHAYDYPGNIRELENILERAVALCEHDEIRVDDLDFPSRSIPEVETGEKPPVETEELNAYLDDVERKRILGALEETGWNRTAAAKKLGISFRALRYRLQKLNIRK